jgi:Ca2+-binding RTX toxin-like protein
MNTTNFKPTIETLEAREVPTAVSAWMSGSTLYINGTHLADKITVNETGYQQVQVNGANSKSNLSWNFSGVQEIRAYGGELNDLIDLRNVNNIRGVLYGGNGNDTLYGTGQDDYLYGEAGYDTLYGFNGNDKLYGGLHSDRLYGGEGNDWLESGTKGEFISGGNGQDWDAHTWAYNGTTSTDVNQTGVGSCVFLSSLAAVTRNGKNLTNWITYSGNHQYNVYLYDAGIRSWTLTSVYFDGSYIYSSDGRMMDAQPQVEGEFWVLLMQRAYLKKFEGRVTGDQMAAFGGESTGVRAMTSILGPVAANDYGTGDYATWMSQKLAAGKSMIAFASSNGNGNHAYAITQISKFGTTTWVRLFNPWGYDSSHNGMHSDFNDGVNDGYIWVTFTTFRRWFFNMTVAG